MMHVAEKRNFADTAMFIKVIMCSLSIEHDLALKYAFLHQLFEREREKKGL